MSENLNLHTIDTVDVSPFKKLVMTIGELPTSFVESMTYYEALAWFVKYLQTEIIPTVNNNAEAVEELQSLFTTLYNYVHDYFDNLDVQEEINNKLDQMVEDGTLQEIITTYIQTQAIWCFDTVSSMQASTNLINGSFARTLGYYSKNDGGGAIYKITDTEPSGKYETIGALYAELISNSVNPMHYGCYGDGTHDDTTALNTALTDARTKNVDLISSPSKVYLISSSIDVSNIHSYWYNSTIKTNSDINMVVINSTTENTGSLRDIIIDCNSTNSNGLVCTQSHGFKAHNITILNLNKNGIKIDAGYEFDCDDVKIYGTGTDNDSTGIYYHTSDCTFTNVTMKDCHIGVNNVYGGRFTGVNIHPWILNTAIEPGSIAYKAVGNSSYQLTNCQSDSYHYAVYVEGVNAPIIQLNNFVVLWATYVQTDEVIGDNLPVVFYASNEASYARMSVSGLRATGLNWTAGKASLCNRSDFSADITGSSVTKIDEQIAKSSLTSIYNDLTPAYNVVTKSGGSVGVRFRITPSSLPVENITLGRLPYFFRDSSENYPACATIINNAGTFIKTLSCLVSTNGTITMYNSVAVDSSCIVILEFTHQVVKQPE